MNAKVNLYKINKTYNMLTNYSNINNESEKVL